MAHSPDALRELRRLFDIAMELAPADRIAWLATLDPALRTELDALLVAVDEPTRADGIGTPEAITAAIGERLGPYHIVRMIGRGGMGAVYEAVRSDDQYHKRVAIKLVQAGVDSELALARFRRERQILANLEHRNIATLLDGGVTAEGRPFLVMEYVEGEPITTWCDRRALPVAGRVALLRQVCAAVHHAHRNLVIHRDLKPGNILVTEDGTVKLLDFGIAKLLGDSAEDATMPLTRGESRAFTPEYASPEQLRGLPLSTASDIYSLGVVAFELLTGRRPHITAGQSFGELERTILEAPIPDPSAVVTTASALQRGERDGERLRRRLRGDLDDILLTALHPEPQQRYPSAEALSEDLRLHQAGMPIAAHRDWTAYRVRKFLRRNTGTVAASALGVLALVGGIFTTMAQARRAQAEQQTTEQVNNFLRVILSSVRTSTGGRDLPVSELLDSAAVRLGTELASNPAVRAPLEAVIGESYQSLGLFEPAEKHLVAAVTLRRQLDGERSDPFIVAINNLGLLGVARGELDGADSAFHQALALQRALHPVPDTMTALILGNLGSIANGRGDFAASDTLHTEALHILQATARPGSDLIAVAMNNLAVSYGNQTRLAAAESLHRASLVLFTANHPDSGRAVADAMNSLASVLDLQGKQAAADSMYRATLALRRKVLGPTHPDYTFTLINYAMFLYDLKRYDEAAKDAREILALRGSILPESHPAIAGALQTLGRCLDNLGDHAGAEHALEESLALRTRYSGPDTWLVGSSERVLGEHFTLMGEYPRAEATLLKADRILRKALGETHPNTLLNVRSLAALYDAWHRPAEAAAQRARIPATGT